MCLAYQMNGLTVTFPVLFQGSKLSWPAIRFHSCSSDFFSCCVSLCLSPPVPVLGLDSLERSSWRRDASGHTPGRAMEQLLGRDFRKGEISTSMAGYGMAEKDIGCWRVLGRVPQHIHLSSVLVKLSWKSTCRSSPGGAWWRRSPWCALQILLLCPGETRLLFFT